MHATKESGCSDSVVDRPDQYPNFNHFGLNFLDIDSNITNYGNPVKWESYQIENPDTIYEAHVDAGSCHSHSHANSCVAIGSAEFASGCSGVIQNYGLAQAISDSTCRAEAYSFSVAGVTVFDDKDLLKGNIDWEAFFECGKKGKGHTIIQKSGSNDPINFYIKDSITGKDTLGTLLSIHFSFYTGLDTLSQLYYWRSDTVHIESDSSEFKIIYPSNLTSLNGSLIINVNGGMVSSIVKTGNYSTFNQVLVGQFLPLHFYLNDSLHFHYNLDSM